jgi:hypothetical protein
VRQEKQGIKVVAEIRLGYAPQKFLSVSDTLSQ